MGKSSCLLRATFCLLAVALGAEALMFNLLPNAQKCLRDEMQAHQLIVGDFEVTDAPGQQINYVVSDRWALLVNLILIGLLLLLLFGKMGTV